MGFAYPSSETPMSGTPESQYIPSHNYTKKLSTAHYPDIHYNGYAPPPAEQVGPESHRYREGDFVSPGFFEHVTPELFALPPSEIEWSYNLRRTAQRILPFLYLGPWSYLSNQQWLRDEGITLLLGVRDQRLAHSRLYSGQKAAEAVGIESDSFDIADNSDAIARLPAVIRRINDHVYPIVNPNTGELAPMKKVLVFCETGNGHSALVTVAYCMVMLNMSLSQALNFIHSQRFCIDMEDGLKPMLAAFEDVLKAKQDVESSSRAFASSSLAVPQMALSKKRSFADQMEDDDMGDSYDNWEMETSKPPAPFQDR
ncbi:dual specificity protein phosphatase family protein [Aspergillus undulatus]|uniref:dual specificity protein phosphatase family protein n=1 Tax=Aspergillus undulatus TaxID=1810928 RepID=UPI003CCE362C